MRGLKTCIGELKVLCAEAASILRSLLIDPSAAIARGLCTRFRILQTHFAKRYREARELALAVLGSIRVLRKAP